MIPDEAVEAALVAFAEAPDRRPATYDEMQAANREQMRLALEAAAPHLMAAAWDECEAAKYEIRLNPESNAWEPVKDNPYRKLPDA